MTGVLVMLSVSETVTLNQHVTEPELSILHAPAPSILLVMVAEMVLVAFGATTQECVSLKEDPLAKLPTLLATPIVRTRELTV